MSSSLTPVPPSNRWVNWTAQAKPGTPSPAVFESKLEGLVPGPKKSSSTPPPSSPATENRVRRRSDLTAHMDITDARRERSGEIGSREREFSSAVPLFDASSLATAANPLSTPISTPTARNASDTGSLRMPSDTRSLRPASASEPASTHRRSSDLVASVPFRLGPCDQSSHSISATKSEAPASSRAQYESSAVGALISGGVPPPPSGRPASSRRARPHCPDIRTGADLQVRVLFPSAPLLPLPRPSTRSAPFSTTHTHRARQASCVAGARPSSVQSSRALCACRPRASQPRMPTGLLTSRPFLPAQARTHSALVTRPAQVRARVSSTDPNPHA